MYQGRKKEPLKSLILGTVGTYSGNIKNDLQSFFEPSKNSDEKEKTEFLGLYQKEETGAVNTELKKFFKRKTVTHKDIKELFDGYEAHHIIPANFLWNNKYVEELLSQKDIKFGFNHLENLAYIPKEKHRGKKLNHNKYDAYIEKLIRVNLEEPMGKKNYKRALDELKLIVSEVKVLFQNKVLIPNGKTLDELP